jgi:hypothetical protein
LAAAYTLGIGDTILYGNSVGTSTNIGNELINGSVTIKGPLELLGGCQGCPAGGSGTVNAGNAGALTFYPSGGTTVDDASLLFWNNTGTHFGIGTTTPATYAVTTIEATSTGAVPLLVRGFTGQSGDLFRIVVPEGGGGAGVATSTKLTVSSAGNLGLNTTTPGSLE